MSAWLNTLSARARRYWSSALLLFALAALAGCVVGGYDGDADVGYGVDYYEPYGYEYGGWGPGYGIGPPRRGYDRGRDGYDHGGHDDGHPGPRPSYRPAPASRPMPSLPSRSGGPSHPGGRSR